MIQLSQGDLEPFYFAPRFPTPPKEVATPISAKAAGEALGEDWANRLSDRQLGDLRSAERIPKTLDQHLLTVVKKCLTGFDGSPQHAADLRAGFTTAIASAAEVRLT